MSASPQSNFAFVFIKPHAVTEDVKALAKTTLEAKGIKILEEGSLKGETIDEKKLIDQHYYAIASKAVILKPDQLNVPADKFQEHFGLSWADAMSSGKVFNAMDGCKHLGIDATELDAAWAKAKAAKKLVKFGGGFYCGLVEVEGKDPVYILNGFFMAMRSKFTKPGTEIYYYSVEWEADKLSWADFRGKVLGPTDPVDAPADSLRGQILARWQELGLAAEPNVGDNGMHASASPFEGFAERNNWLSVPVAEDAFGKQILSAGLPESLIKDWSVDPQVAIGDGKKGSIFDQLEDLDSAPCLEKLTALLKLNAPAEAARSPNCAFVFIKPHAVTEDVKALAKSTLEAKGIRILQEGSLKGETIDEKKLIDQHYYAIASKAVILKPDQLNVPVDKFQEHFGLSWADAMASSKVFNAMDGCKHLGIDATELDAAWAKAKAAKKLVKFGGGFYCGLVEVDGKDPVYILNGFFMAMRSKFTKPGTEIYYYSVEWDADKLSWADFRGKVLGPTDPADAPADSLRGQILARWQELGLAAEPNVGDNGMHASASPFEGFAERNNWLSVPVAEDAFGKQMLSAGLPEPLIKEWSVDPQVAIGDGKKGSIFDQLEDLDSAPCLEKLGALLKLNAPADAARSSNFAFVFIKPHAVTQDVKALAKSTLEAKGIKILEEGSLKGETIDEKKLIDQHYYAIASKAVILKPDQLNVPADKFQEHFGLSWADAMASGKVFNAMDGCKHLGIDATELDAAWAKAKAAKKLVKFGGGFYCGLVDVEGKDQVYILNGFFMAMRSKFTKPGTEIHYFSVEWEADKLSWADFRGKVLGPTDPADAPADSLRGQILARWQELGLAAEPNVGDNGMHASASPFEGFAERNNWLSVPVAEDAFGKQMLCAGLPESLIKDWSVDPQVTIADGKQGSIFDQLEDLDSAPCLEKLTELLKLNAPAKKVHDFQPPSRGSCSLS